MDKKDIQQEYSIYHVAKHGSLGISSKNEELLRLKREWINAAVEFYGNDLVKIEEYVSSRSVA